jgi:WD40 repeat protein
VVFVDRSGAQVARIVEAAGQRVESIGFSPDGRLLATTRVGIDRFDPEEMKTMIWDWNRGDVVRELGTFSDLLAFDPTGSRIATARAVEGTADVWDAQTGARMATLVAPAEIGDIAYSPDGKVVATGHADGTVRLWDPATGAERLVLGGDGVGRIAYVVFGADGSTLASLGDDGVVRVWALDLDELVAIANDRLARTSRAFSDAECLKYLHLDRCPLA